MRQIKCHFDILHELKVLKIVCQHSCKNEFYVSAITASKYEHKAYSSQTQYVFSIQSKIREILLTHMPRFIDYLHSFGV